ncbi:MAG: electron transfer flavoprotein subunit beta/FixA family protein [Oscillospiraceae bacterium]|nr:electron transfer flavoprotein subunit beta/FixA family protein [Oscillospiraceae bacterium]
MNILVCVKQVPDTSGVEIQIDPQTGALLRDGVPSIVNPYDKYALERAVRLKETHGGMVTVVSMGPPQAEAALRECLAVGADRAVLLSDRVFAGSDTFATSYILAAAARKLGGFDLIFCGKHAIDGDTGQVGPELAEHLGIAQITYVAELELSGSTLRAKREHEEGYERYEAALPVLVSVVKTETEPRFPTIKGKMAANRAEIVRWTVADLEINPAKVGLAGSPTKVLRSFTPTREKVGVMIAEGTAAEKAKQLISLLGEAKVI